MSRRGEPRLKKALGQHHLVRPESCAPLLQFLQAERARVVEVGPGGGILTRQLLERASRVDVVEMDPEWAFSLAVAERDSALGVVVADAMTIEWGALARPTLVTGNLPYQISTALIERLLRHADRIPRAAFLVQREVAERLVARPGSSAYGSLSVLVATCSKTTFLGRVARGAFRPPPKVEGAFVGLELREPPFPTEELSDFAATVRAAFGLRRKTLRNSLAAAWGREASEDAVAGLGCDHRARAEELDISAFLRLHELRQGA